MNDNKIPWVHALKACCTRLCCRCADKQPASNSWASKLRSASLHYVATATFV